MEHVVAKQPQNNWPIFVQFLCLDIYKTDTEETEESDLYFLAVVI